MVVLDTQPCAQGVQAPLKLFLVCARDMHPINKVLCYTYFVWIEDHYHEECHIHLCLLVHPETGTNKNSISILAQTVKFLEYHISGLNKNLTKGSSHAHVMDSAGSLMWSIIIYLLHI